MRCDKIKILDLKSHITKDEFGGKSYGLTILSQNNIKVPYGICISIHLWKIFTNNGEHKARDLPTDIENCLKVKIKDIISEMVIIRSSGLIEDTHQHSFAGIFESVIVPNKWDKIRNGIIKVLNSSFSKRAEVYSKQFNLPFPSPMAIIIQEVIEADFSGVTFTIDPRNKEYLLIEVIPGIGSPLVSGKLSPDRYYLSRSNLNVINQYTSMKEYGLWIEDKKLATKEKIRRKLPFNIIKEIARLSLQVENIFSKPQDIEWCVKDDKISLLQSRPITRIVSDIPKKTKQYEDTEIPDLKGVPGSPGVVSGKAYVVRRSFNFSVETGRILVAPMTDPDMVPEIVKSSGVVTDRGGVISHAAIIAREMGIPCVVGTENATKLISTNDDLKVDGNKGIVWILSKTKYLSQNEKTDREETFRISGREVSIRSLRIVRKEPLVPEIWHFPWQETYKGSLKFISPRPEIVASPLTQSIVMPAIESIPYILGLGDRELITTLYRGTIHVEYEYFKQIFETLRDKLIVNYDFSFMKKYMNSVKHSYNQIEQASKKLLKFINKMDKLTAEKTLITLFEWWKVHNNFFARTYLIQAIGDDIVWPFIRQHLCSYLPENKISDVINILLKPIEISLSSKFLKEAFSIIDMLPERYRTLIKSNKSDDNFLKIIKTQPEYKSFEKRLEELTRKWGWMRTRDFYFSPLDDPNRMLSFLRKTVFSSERQMSIDVKTNLKRFDTLIRQLQQILPKEAIKVLQFAVFLNQHRNEHFYIWIKSTDAVIKYFYIIASFLEEKGILNDKRDIFFLFTWEIVEIIKDHKNFNRVKSSIIPRKCHFVEGNKLSPSEVGLDNLKCREVKEKDGYWE